MGLWETDKKDDFYRQLQKLQKELRVREVYDLSAKLIVTKKHGLNPNMLIVFFVWCLLTF